MLIQLRNVDMLVLLEKIRRSRDKKKAYNIIKI